MNETRMICEAFASMHNTKVTNYLHVAWNQAFFVIEDEETGNDLLYVIETGTMEVAIRQIGGSDFAKIDKRGMVALMKRIGGGGDGE